MAAEFNAAPDRFLIDYDHQTIHQTANGGKAPAAGWADSLEVREDGVYALNVDWTNTAKTAINDKEYRYISPVIAYNKRTGDVVGVLMAALVNYPALEGLTDLAAAHFNFSTDTNEVEMKEVIVLLCAILGLQTDATEAALMAELKGIQSMLEKDGKTEALKAILTAKNSEIATLAAKINTPPDPSKYAPVEALAALQSQLSEITKQINGDKVAALIEAALSDGRLLPAQKAWAEDLGKSNFEALSTFVKNAQPIAALTGGQNGPGDKRDTGGKSADEIAFLATRYQTEQLAAGVVVDDVAAVLHVTKAA